MGTALGLVGLVYLVGFGQGVVDAVGSLLGTEGPGPAVDGVTVAVSGSVAQLGSAAGLVALVVFGCRVLGVSVRDLGWGRPRGNGPVAGPRAGRSGLPGEVVAGVVFLVAYVASVVVDVVFSGPGYPEPGGSTVWVLDGVGSAVAGPTEEFAVVALPTVLLRRAGWGCWRIGALAVSLRVAFHLYYGWGVVGIAVWAVLTWAWYARTGRLVGPVVVHTVIDLSLAVWEAPGPVVALWVVALLVGCGLLVRALRRTRRTRRAGQGPGRTRG